MERLLILLLICGVLLSACCAENYYEIFGMSRQNFEKRHLSKAYKRLAKTLHPDKNPDPKARERLYKISEAYEVLNDDDKRRIYDMYGEEGLKSGAHGHNDFHPEDIFEQFFGSGFKFDFGNGFGGGGGRQKPQRRTTADVKVELKITLEDAYKGADLTVNLNRQQKCKKCDGVGAEKPDDVVACQDCKGSGMKVYLRQLGPGMMQQIQTTCDRCRGQGRVFKSVCRVCRGERTMRGQEPLKVSIPAGCPRGHVIKYKGMADESAEMDAGDLYIVAVPEDHPVFRRTGHNLHAEVTIGLADALLGFSKEIAHLDGHKVKVARDDQVTQPGQVLTIDGEGMPEYGSSPQGHLYVTVNVVLPPKLTDKQKALFKQKEFTSWRDEL